MMRNWKDMCLCSVFVITALLIIGVGSIGTEEHQSPQDNLGFNVPPEVKKMLENEGVTIADLKNDRELRRRWLVRLRRLRGTKEKVKPRVRNDFYKVIITNNLFRPLGYKKPTPGPMFKLLATVVDRKSGKSKALLRNNKDRKIYYVGVGVKLAGALVEKIESNSVTLSQNGKSEEFRLQRDALLY